MGAKTNLNKWFIMSVLLLAMAPAAAQAIVDMEWVTVGDPRNAADTELMNDGTTSYGTVNYCYLIGKYEVTNEQYCEFLNAVAATDIHGLYNSEMASSTYGGIERSGSSGTYTYSVKVGLENRPVNFVSFYDCLRFINWINNDQPTGEQDEIATEDGAYDMSREPVVVRKERARFWLPSEDEWHKAAYYKGSGTNKGYWNYATQTYMVPTFEYPPGTDMTNGSANYNNVIASTTNVGAYSAKPSFSAYGAFDLNGNLWEWNEALIGSYRGIRGGAFDSNSASLKANYRNWLSPSQECLNVGFRVARQVAGSSGVIIYVDADAPGNNDGSTWANAYNYLQDALAVANCRDEIRVAQGIYKPDESLSCPEGSGNRTVTFQLIEDLALYGGYAGYGESNPDARNVTLYKTVLSGDLDGDDDGSLGSPSMAENSYNVVRGIGKNASTIVEGFTVTAGNANEGSNSGGGICRAATIRDCNIIGNYSKLHMGGGGLYLCGPIINCTVTGNSHGTVAYGGGGCCYCGPIKDCLISRNHSRGDGGGVFECSPIIGCTFVANSAFQGGAIGTMYSFVSEVNNCIFKDNSASFGGGIGCMYSGSAIVTNSIFIGNSSSNGGGINFDSRGINSGTITNCTFVANSGGILNEGDYIQVNNCIFWENSDYQISGITNTTVTYSDVQGGWSGVGWNNIDSDPCFADVGNGDYRLLPGSPCINAGSNDAVPPDTLDLDGDGDTTEPIPYDLSGNPRIIGAVVDMGAYEGAFVNSAPTACIVGGDRIVLTETACECEAVVTLDSSCSSDPDSTPGTNNDIVSFNWYEGESLLGNGEILQCTLSIGEHIIILEVADRADEKDACTAIITVRDTNPPEITRNGPWVVVLECGLDTYTEQGATATDLCDGEVPVAIGGDTVDTSVCGKYIITYDATDSSGNAAEQTNRIVIVQDTTPPEFTLSVTPDTLWPPDNKMVEITPTWTVSDICDPAPEVSLQSITIIEGDDIQVSDDGSIYLRAKSGGRPNGRIYLITYQAVDAAGNTTTVSATVTVPAPRDK